MKKILITGLALLSLISPTMAIDDYYNFSARVESNYYGLFTGEVDVTLKTYNADGKILWQKEYPKHAMKNGVLKFSLADSEFVTQENVTLGIFVHQYDEEIMMPFSLEPFAKISKEALSVEWDGIKNKPEIGFDGKIEKKDDETVIGIDINNLSKNNETGASLTLQADANKAKAKVALTKNAAGKTSLVLGTQTENNIEIQHNNKAAMTISENEISFTKPLKGKGSGLTDIPFSALNMNKDQLLSLGLPSQDTTLTDEQISALGYIKQDTHLSQSQVGDLAEKEGFIKLNAISKTYIQSLGLEDKTLSKDQVIAYSNDTFVKATDLAYPGANKSTSAASKIGFFDSLQNSDSIDLQSVITDIDSAISSLSSSLQKNTDEQTLSLSGDILSLVNGGAVNLEKYTNTDTQLSESQVDAFVANNGYLTSVSWSDLKSIPADIADGDANTQLSESQVDSYVANNGYASTSDPRFSDSRTPKVSSQTNGDILYFKDGWKRLAKGNDNQVLSLSSGYPKWIDNVVDTDTNTWQQNTVSQEGYVPAGAGNPSKVWKTDSSGVPAWRTDTDTKLTDAEIGAMGYTKSSSADSMSSTQVNNIQANKLANGTTPWTSKLDATATAQDSDKFAGQTPAYYHNAANLTGTVNNDRLDSSVTKLGNTTNGASQLVQLDASGRFPARNGSQITNLNASNIASGTINNAQIPVNITGKDSVESKTMKANTLTVGSIVYSADEDKSGEGVSMFGDYVDLSPALEWKTTNHIYQAKTDGYLVMRVWTYSNQWDSMHIYMNKSLTDLKYQIQQTDSFFSFTASDTDEAKVWDNSFTLPIPKGTYFQVESRRSNYNSRRFNVRFIGFGKTSVKPIF